MKPETKYTKSGPINIAYQVIGDGPIDIVYIPGWVSNIDMMWTNSRLAEFLERLAQFSRLILFDKRGTGLSDRVTELCTLEERMDDIRAVMDAAGSEQAALFGHSEGGSVSALFAATYPHRTRALITFGVFAKRKYSEDYPWAPTDEQRQEFYDAIQSGWGGGEMEFGQRLAPSLADDREFMDWIASYLRSGASPGAALALARMNSEVDITHVLDSIRVPTLLMYRTGDTDVNVEEGRYMAKRIQGAKFIELPGDDHLFWVGDKNQVIYEIAEFLTGTRPMEDHNRALSTILFTDIVDSTSHLAQAGNKQWKKILDRHNGIVRTELNRFRGREVKSTGDGFLATFDGPGRAVRCACGIRDAMRALDIQITAGIHTGECEIIGVNDIGGIAVHTASRVLKEARPNEILVTQTVRHLLSGSGMAFTDIGSLSLKGLPQKLSIYALKDEVQTLP
jgi:pimeloyl-ACP methyl ester carboxylesterase